MSQHPENQEEDPILKAARASAARAKSIVRMLLILRIAKPPAKQWFEQNQDTIYAYARALKTAKEGEIIEPPKVIGDLFASLPYSKKKKEIEEKYDAYYQAWIGMLHQKGSKKIMLARLSAIKKHNLTEENSEKEILIALCDALSDFSSSMKLLEESTYYIP